MTRKKIIAGNWKMNTNLSEATALAHGILDQSRAYTHVEIVLCPPYISLTQVGQIIKGTHIKLGAQDVHWEENGAYTGKISVAMLKDVGVKYVIIGHSEQRSCFNESNITVNKKLRKVIGAGLTPIVCVGETLSEREAGNTEKIVEDHVRGAYMGLSGDDALKTVIAYEPVWAIGTGKTATADQAQEVHAFIRNLLSKIFDANVAASIQIQYGGSMKAENAIELLGKSDVDGGLIGGAALKAESFIGIIAAA